MNNDAGVRVEGMDHEGPHPYPWRLELDTDGSGTVTVDHLRRRLATMVDAGTPAVIASVDLEAPLRATLDLVAEPVDLYLSTNMPGDQRVYVYSAAARALVGL